MKKFDNILKNFLFTELAQEGQKIVMEGEGRPDYWTSGHGRGCCRRHDRCC